MLRDPRLEVVERLVDDALDVAAGLDARRLGGAQVATLDQVMAGLREVRRLADASAPRTGAALDEVLDGMRSLVQDAVEASERLEPRTGR